MLPDMNVYWENVYLAPHYLDISFLVKTDSYHIFSKPNILVCHTAGANPPTQKQILINISSSFKEQGVWHPIVF